jgi:hypothetical protein
MYKPYICKMYISVHNLNNETGRFYDLDGHERVCSMCNLNVEDEYHHILQCGPDHVFSCNTIIRNKMKLSVANLFT